MTRAIVPGKEEAAAFVERCSREVQHGRAPSLLDIGGLIQLAYGNGHVFIQGPGSSFRLIERDSAHGTWALTNGRIQLSVWAGELDEPEIRALKDQLERGAVRGEP